MFLDCSTNILSLNLKWVLWLPFEKGWAGHLQTLSASLRWNPPRKREERSCGRFSPLWPNCLGLSILTISWLLVKFLNQFCHNKIFSAEIWFILLSNIFTKLPRCHQEKLQTSNSSSTLSMSLQYLICFSNQETTSLLAQIHLFLQPLGPNKLTVSPSLPEPINFHLQCFHVNFSRCICPLHDLK